MPCSRSLRARSYRFHGFANLAGFARERLGTSPRKAQALLRLERTCEDSPELRAAFRSGRLSWVQAHALIPVLGLEHAGPWRAAWVAHAEAISVRRLEEDVERALVTNELDPRSLSPHLQTGAHPTVENPEDQCLGSLKGTATLFFVAPADVARLFKAVLATVQRRIERRNGRTASESEALDAMLRKLVGRESEAIPPFGDRARPGRRDPPSAPPALRTTGTCTITTSSSARTAAPTSSGIARRCARRTITAACTRGSGGFASAGARPTGCASSFRS